LNSLACNYILKPLSKRV